MVAVARIILRTLMTTGRRWMAGGLLVLIVGIAGLVRYFDGPREVVANMLLEAGIGLSIPVAALIFASGALGDHTEDNTLVYIWRRPIQRLHIALGATAAASAVAVPIAVVPLVAAVFIAGSTSLLGPALLGSILGAMAYVSLFVALGVLTKRATIFGLLYVLVVENLLARATQTFAAISVREHASSIVAVLGDLRGVPYDNATWVAVLSLLAITGVGIGWTWRLLLRREIA